MTEFHNNAADDAAADGSTAELNAAPDAEAALPVLDVEDQVYGISAEDKYNEAAEERADEAWARAAAELSAGSEQPAAAEPSAADEPGETGEDAEPAAAGPGRGAARRTAPRAG